MSDTQAGLDLEAIRKRAEWPLRHLSATGRQQLYDDRAALIAEVERLRGEARAQQPDGEPVAWRSRTCRLDGGGEAVSDWDQWRLHHTKPELHDTGWWRHELQPLYARAQQDDARGWRPIAELPERWASGLVWTEGRVHFAQWSPVGGWFSPDHGDFDIPPTHWMPLPAAPSEQSE